MLYFSVKNKETIKEYYNMILICNMYTYKHTEYMCVCSELYSKYQQWFSPRQWDY